MQEISNITIVNVKDGLVSHQQTIQIDGQSISAIGPAASDQILKSDIEELWAIPGLIDCHVHLFERHDDNDPDGIYRYDDGYEADKYRALKNLRNALDAGITCVRDVGAYEGYNNKLRDFIEANQTDRPYRVVSCGRHITRTDKDEDPHFWDRGVAWNPKKESLKEVIYREAELGADFIKIMNDNRIFDFEELKQIVGICRELGKKLACHAFKSDTVEDAIRAGINSVEHAVCFTNELIEIALEQGTVFCPTLIAAQDSVDCQKDSKMANTLEKAITDCEKHEYIEWLDLLYAHLPTTFKSGVKVIAGTDAGIFPTNFQSLHREITSYIDHGATELQALQTATINAAEALDIDDKVGTIEVGKSADIVLLKKNPLKDLRGSLADIALVMSRGKIVLENRGI